MYISLCLSNEKEFRATYLQDFESVVGSDGKV